LNIFMIKKALIVLLFLIVSGLLFFNFFENAVLNSTVNDSNIPIEFEIEEGQTVKKIGKELEDNNLITNKYFFYFYVWKNDLTNKVKAGKLEISSNLTVPEITAILIEGENKPEIKKVTIPEGFTNKKIIERLKGMEPQIGNEFNKIASCQCFQVEEECACGKVLEKYDFLKNIPEGVDVEGYLFPDTYFIDDEDTAEILVMKFLNNFQKQVDSDLMEEIKRQGKSLHEIIIIASMIEKEAKTAEDRRIVSGIFWKRVNDEYPLQSCATLAYVLGVDKKQYSTKDTEIDSPYNTYKNSGLPPGPIANPGLDAIKAAVYPDENNFYFFLTDPGTGEMVYSVTLDEHNRNKVIHGL
ncbi:MAG: endolytic transglycosylase MltG, partial [Patescibacteria group bacterium]|nr:endolytic transglycosylase MltG [Patescibacteria group bacterium]